MFRWAEPFYFWFFGFLVFMIFLYLYSWKAQQRVLRNQIGDEILKSYMKTFLIKNKKLKNLFQILCLLGMVLALCRPQWGQKEMLVDSTGAEVVVLFDVSKSMLAEDLSPSRLEAAKKEVAKWAVSSHVQNRFALIAFAGSAVTVSPLTQDEDAFKSYLEFLSENVITYQGTSFSEALKEAEGVFKRGGLIGSGNKIAGVRLVLLVSDGEIHDSLPKEALKFFKDNKIPIFTLGVGTKKGGLIPIRNSQGGFINYLQDSKGEVVLSIFHSQGLKRLAKETGGSFIPLTQDGSLKRKINEQMNKLKKSQLKSQEVFLDFDEKYFWFLIMSSAFFFLQNALRLRKEVKG